MHLLNFIDFLSSVSPLIHIAFGEAGIRTNSLVRDPTAVTTRPWSYPQNYHLTRGILKGGTWRGSRFSRRYSEVTRYKYYTYYYTDDPKRQVSDLLVYKIKKDRVTKDSNLNLNIIEVNTLISLVLFDTLFTYYQIRINSLKIYFFRDAAIHYCNFTRAGTPIHT